MSSKRLEEGIEKVVGVYLRCAEDLSASYLHDAGTSRAEDDSEGWDTRLAALPQHVFVQTAPREAEGWCNPTWNASSSGDHHQMCRRASLHAVFQLIVKV